MYTIPESGAYRRKRDGVSVQVIGCTGNTSFRDVVSVRSAAKLSHVRLENFWKKYEAIAEGAAVTEPKES
jgi:hypothetical protein